jgi:hypothetical protein
MIRNLALSIFSLLLATIATAQETLPKFSASLKPNGKIIISWHNSYRIVNQISIQRSIDSLKNFTTLLTVPDASVSENGFVDTKAANTHMFYRLFIVLDSGKYIFTKSKRPSVDTVVTKEKNIESNDNVLSKTEMQRLTYLQKNNDSVAINAPDKINAAPNIVLNKIIFIKKQDSVIGQLFERAVNKFRDSILTKTKDTLVFKDGDTIMIKVFVPKEVYKVSQYVFTSKESNVNIALSDADKKKYSVKFFETDGSALFEIKEVKQSLLIVDKTNFLHSGWFRFELYEDGKLKEKNKFFIPKDF